MSSSSPTTSASAKPKEPAVTIAVTGESVVQGQLTTLVLPSPNEPGVQGVGTLVVTTLADEDDGGSEGTGLSLREAISMASGGDTIIFDPSLNNSTTTDGVITLGLGELVIDKSLTIIGDLDGDDSTRDITVDADGKSQVFRINDRDVSKSEVNIDGLLITGGVASVISFFLVDINGGGINNNEFLKLTNSTISGNSARSDGGGIYNSGTTEITNSTISGNSARSDGGGISISFSGRTEITDSTISDNFAGQGGGIKSDGTAQITNSTISGNFAGQGGGIKSDSTAQITNSTISGNSARFDGGGISSRDGNVQLTNSTISGNSAGGGGGGIFNGYESRTKIANSTISGNSADDGGGIFTDVAGYYLTVLEDSIVSGNTANSLGNEIFVYDRNFYGYSVSVYTNAVDANGGNLFGDSSQTNAEAFYDFTPGVSNINATSDGINVALTDILDANLADNGGSTLTHALVAGSPAIDTGKNPLLLTTDQRGLNREFDGDQNGIATADIGAFELQFAAILRVTLPDSTSANGVDDITFGTPLSLFRDSAIDSNLVRPNFADTFQFIDITNISDEETVTISSIDINAPGVSISPQGDFLLNPGETERVNLTYQPLIADEAFDLSNGLVINSNAINSAFEVHLSGRSTFNSDINYDGAVELRDIEVFNANLGSEIGDANFDPTADINGDGIINSEDLEILNTEFGMLISLPDLIVVDTLEDEDDGDFSLGDRSLREALTRINEGGTIIFAPGLNNGSTTDGVITLSLGELVIDKSLTIIGDLDGDDSTHDITVDADGNSRVFRINDGVSRRESTVSIDGLVITGGVVSGDDFQDRRGGGIRNSESLNLTNSTILGNSADDGGGIANFGTTEITNATISGNSADDRGGGIENFGTTEITNSTISGNSADNGGGIFNFGTTEITNSTISGNSADNDGGGIFNSFSDVIFLSSSIVSGNTSEESGNEVYNRSNGQINADNSNLFGDNSQSNTEAFFNFTPGDNDINATSDGINIALDNILNPSLADNGGPTLTHALVPGSPAIDTGTNPLGLTTDQRGEGFPRSNGNGVDIGAFESEFFDAIVVDTLEDENDGDFSEGDRSLREALLFITEGGTISFAPDLNNGTTTDGIITLSLGELIINKTLTINGDLDGDDSTRDITIDADGNSRVFNINDGNNANIKVINIDSLTITGGVASSDNFQDSSGGGIYSRESLNLTNSTVSGNSADAIGGGIRSNGPTQITNSTISDNSARGRGGGIRSNGSVQITNSTISANSTDKSGGGILSKGRLDIISSTISDNSAQYDGGGVYIKGKNKILITNSTISGNASEQDGGGIYKKGNGKIEITNSTISGNRSEQGGGGIYKKGKGKAEITNSTLSGNAAKYAGGGIYDISRNTIQIANSTITDNTANKGGGVYNADTYIPQSILSLSSNLISGNIADESGNEVFNQGRNFAVNANAHNLFGDSSQTNDDAFYNFTPGSTDISATSDGISIALTDILDLNLADNGGPTLTHALVEDSPAIDAGTNSLGLTTDQRGEGFPRSLDSGVDIGAFELQNAIGITATSISDEESLTISHKGINIPAVSLALQDDFLLNPRDAERMDSTYESVIAKESFDLDDDLLINSNEDKNTAFQDHLSGRSTFNSDIHYDGAINLGELEVLNAHFGSQIGDANFDFSADINRDSRINLGALNTEFGSSLPVI